MFFVTNYQFYVNNLGTHHINTQYFTKCVIAKFILQYSENVLALTFIFSPFCYLILKRHVFNILIMVIW